MYNVFVFVLRHIYIFKSINLHIEKILLNAWKCLWFFLKPIKKYNQNYLKWKNFILKNSVSPNVIHELLSTTACKQMSCYNAVCLWRAQAKNILERAVFSEQKETLQKMQLLQGSSQPSHSSYFKLPVPELSPYF